MHLTDLKESLIDQIKNSNYVLLALIYLLSVITAVIITLLYMKRNNINSYKQDDFLPTNENTVSSDSFLIVDISGAVNSPGVYKLDEGSRLSDLIKVANGLNEDASEKIISKNLNLSQKLSDAQKIYIPFKWDEPEDTYSSNLNKFIDISTSIATTQENVNGSEKIDTATSQQINVNTASSDELDTLEGVGVTYSQKIVTNRPYQDIEDFKQRSGLPISTINKFISQIVF